MIDRLPDPLADSRMDASSLASDDLQAPVGLRNP